MEEIITIINTVGFPIFAFVLMWKLANETIRDNSNAIIELREFIKERK